MSEKIYAWLLRLYPSRFREEYGDAALELFRDRASDERGFFARLRLWLDLLSDLAVSIPREYRGAQPALAAAPADIRPCFYFAANESPRAGALLIGALLSLVPVFALAIPFGHSRLPHLSFAPMRRRCMCHGRRWSVQRTKWRGRRTTRRDFKCCRWSC